MGNGSAAWYSKQKNKTALAPVGSPLAASLEGSSLQDFQLHGDLWIGNVLVNTNGEPIVIDPVVYYGDAEADVSLTYIFRGFTVSFYQAVSQKTAKK